METAMQSPDNRFFSTSSGNLYYEFAEIPVYTGAQYVQRRSLKNTEEFALRVSLSVADHLRNVRRVAVKHVLVSTDSEDGWATPAQDQADAIATYVSPSGRFLVVLRDCRPADSSTTKRFVEVWRGDALLAIKDVTPVHGAFYADEVFASGGFDKDESRFIYTAEANKPSPEDNGSVDFDNYRYAAPFGEKFIGKQRAALFLFKWGLPYGATDAEEERKSYDHKSGQSATCVITRIDPQDFDETVTVSFGQARLNEAGDTIYATGYEHLPDGRFPGILGCFNRPSSLWSLKIGQDDLKKGVTVCKPTRLTPKERSSRSPRYVRHDGTEYLIYLVHELFGPHHSCASMRVLDFSTMKDRKLVDTAWDADIITGGFPGLYLDQLPPRPFATRGGKLHVLLHSRCGTVRTLYCISVEDGTCTRLLGPSQEKGQVFSWTLLATDGEKTFVASRSRADVPNQLVFGTFSDDPNGEVRIRVIDKPYLSPRASIALDRLCQTTFNLPHKPHVESIVIEVINHEGQEGAVNPAIMIPHGGPHISSTSDFNALHAALALENYTLYLPNYTGSIGYGMKYVKELIGKCGELDIEDCIDTTKALVSKGVIREGYGYQFIYGGSHGGFIGAHLIGQFPTFFSGAALRNPVINAGEMIATTDIPDWCYSEFGLKPAARLDSAGYAHLFRRSPIFQAQNIIAPVMLLLGEQDRRVPPSQGLNLYHLLKGKGTPVDMLRFPGKGHSLEEVESSRMTFEAIRWWFRKYRS